jgi:DnaJ-class molecular chaperone
MQDPYEVLGVPKGADINEIKKSYRKLARQLHPDLNPGDRKAEERFKQVAAAYDFLSDAERKARYDRGEIDASGTPRADRRFYRDFADAAPGYRYTDPAEHLHDFEEAGFFAEVFRGMRREQRKMKGADIHERIRVDFLDAARGGQVDVALPDGSRVKVTIPAGAVDGQKLRLKGKGMPSPLEGPPGDLQIEIAIQPHPVFTRSGNDIFVELPITLGEAVLGAKVEVPTVDGKVMLTIPKSANTGQRLRIRAKGVPGPRGGERGDQYVTLQVKLPRHPDPELERLIAEWEAKHPYSVRGS